MRSYQESGFHPPWLVHQIAEIAKTVEKVKVYQSECDKDYAIMKLATELKCPIISSDSDFLLFAVSPIIKCDFNWSTGHAVIYEQNWYQSAGVKLHSYHLPLLSALSYNAECDLHKDDLEPFWNGLSNGDESIPIVAHVASWLCHQIDENNCKSVSSIVQAINGVTFKEGQTSNNGDFNDLKRRDRFIRSVRRMMVPTRKYPWENDPQFHIDHNLVREKIGSHPLLRPAKSSPEFSKLRDEVKKVIVENRDYILNSPLPAPLLTENVLHLYNSIHPGVKKRIPENEDEFNRESDEIEDDFPQYDDISITDTTKTTKNKKERDLPVVSNLLRKYLKRELFVLELDDAEYYRYKEGTSDPRYMYTIIETEFEFSYLSKQSVQPIYHLYNSSKEEKIRAFLACFDAEILMYIDKNITQKPPFIIVFLACLRYLWKQSKLKSWELDAFVAQFSLLDIFTSQNKHFGRLYWLVTGGKEESPVELPASERALILANLFSSVYYASLRAQVICGLPWKDDDRVPTFKDIFSGTVFTCCYQILKENPEYRSNGKEACGLDDQRWIGIDLKSNNESERNCYYKAASIYDKFKKDYINPFAKFDERVREEKRKMRAKAAASDRHQEYRNKIEKEKRKTLKEEFNT